MPSSRNSVSKRAKEIVTRFSHSDNFLKIVNPTTAPKFASNLKAAFTGDYPTLSELNMTYGNTFAAQWLMPEIADLSVFTGAKNLDIRQQRQLADIIATEYYYLKVTELLVFFHWFKAGKYGKFYGSVDPIAITCALREFIFDRNERLMRHDQEQREEREREQAAKNPPVSRQEWEQMKRDISIITAMYNSEYTVTY